MELQNKLIIISVWHYSLLCDNIIYILCISTVVIIVCILVAVPWIVMYYDL